MTAQLTLTDLFDALANGNLVSSNIGCFDSEKCFNFKLSTDTRILQPGDAYLALSGPNFDGNEFVERAIDAGAYMVITTRAIDDCVIPCFTVCDTFLALKTIASLVRSRFDQTQFIAITGSVGKTTTKDIVKLFMSNYGKTEGTMYTRNNHIGVPTTILNLSSDVDYAVVELGMNHVGEIKYLTEIVRPHVAIITAINMNHIGFFDNHQAIAEAKAEIFAEMTSGGIAVINRACNFYELLIQRAKESGITRIISYGRHEEADVKLVDYKPTVEIAGRQFSYSMPNVGDAIIVNSVAAVALAVALDLEPICGAAALQSFTLPTGKGEMTTLKLSNNRTVTIIDESYNSGLEAIIANLVRLKRFAGGRHVAVLADIAELGEHALPIHMSLTEPLQSLDCVITVGEFMRKAVSNGIHFNSVKELNEHIDSLIMHNDVILIKGSHIWGLDQTVKHIKALCI